VDRSGIGGTPRLTWKNASGLVWAGTGQLLFSEMKKNRTWASSSAAQNGANHRDIYLPTHVQGMAHLSYPSPDRQFVLLTEMDQNHVWTPCRVVPMDGSAPGRLVGPQGAGCTFGAWSPDGKWILSHLQRRRRQSHLATSDFPTDCQNRSHRGRPKRKGVAIAADGRSLRDSRSASQHIVVAARSRATNAKYHSKAAPSMRGSRRMEKDLSTRW
jgi:hypothetical protein